MKWCPACQQMKADSAFGKNRSRKDGLQVHCRACVKKIQHDWYMKHKETHTAKVRRKRKELALEIAENIVAYFKSHPCVDCGETDPILLEFDHVRGTKKYTISNRMATGYPWKTILQEIEKCEVRCVSCHRRKTAKQQGHRRAILMGLLSEDP